MAKSSFGLLHDKLRALSHSGILDLWRSLEGKQNHMHPESHTTHSRRLWNELGQLRESLQILVLRTLCDNG